MNSSSNDTHLERCDLLYSALRDPINKNINSIHALFEVSRYLSKDSKKNLYQKDKKYIVDNWRIVYPRIKDQYLILLRASFGYLGFEGDIARSEPPVSWVRQVVACFLLFSLAFPIQLAPNWLAESEIHMLSWPSLGFFQSQRATFVIDLEENYPHQSERSPLTVS